MIKLMNKTIEQETLEVLYNRLFTPEIFKEDFIVRSGDWCVEDGWLTGKNRGNFPGIAVIRQPFYGNIVLDFEARTVPPCTHDINVMWNGSWDEENNVRGIAYVAGIQGWWDGKVGFEKSPAYTLNAATQ